MAPRALELIGRLADGWVPGGGISRIDRFAGLNARIDSAAIAAGRHPEDIRRIVNVSGSITDDGGEQGAPDGPPQKWIDQLTRWAVEHRLDAFVYWPPDTSINSIERFAREVVPAVREAVAAERRPA
jgi:alkanesulfonate monooxygenase SsuD/methylene tetrahydromethanopterin reductase-like flavin-dependent oxidoreductase (luciferase family)